MPLLPFSPRAKHPSGRGRQPMGTVEGNVMTGTSSAGMGSTGHDREARSALVVDRRRLLVGAAVTTLLGAGGAATPAWAGPKGRPNAALLSDGGKRFDVAAPSSMFLDKARLHDATIMQSFAFDDSHSALYVAQVMQGGLQLAGESAPVSAADRVAHGDVCISRLGYGGELQGSMYLRRFGHPIAIGVEPVGAGAYLWIGTASALKTSDNTGYPTRVGRVQFVDGGIVDYPGTNFEVHYPIKGATEISTSLDAQNRTLLVRYRVRGAAQYNLYALDAFRARDYRPLYSQPETGISDVFQGHTHYFDQVYRLEGSSGGSASHPTSVSCFDLPSGKVVKRSVTDAAPSLTFREPEGIAVQRTPLRLHMGFADGKVGARTMSLYYIDRYGA
jgi:hypothetical protein